MQTRQFLARRTALLLVFVLLYQVAFPTVAMALTTGPSTPEVSGFSPVQATDMVDLFTGDFSYNIPLLDVGGYPVNLSYRAGPGMEEEASWVGLGWSLNPGSLTRDMRGLPDDFRGDSITRTFNIKQDITTGLTLGAGVELAGWPVLKKISASRGIYFNTYRGWGFTQGLNPTFAIGKSNKTPMTVSLGLKLDSQQGLDINPVFGLQVIGDSSSFKLKMGASFNTRRGLQEMTLMQCGKYKNDGDKIFGIPSGAITFGSTTYIPTSGMPLVNRSFSFHGTVGLNFLIGHPNVTVNGYQSRQYLAYPTRKQAAFGYLNSQYATDKDIMDFNREREGLPFHKKMVTLPLPFGTYDLYSATGQGLTGQFRAVRNDVGVFHDPYKYSSSSSQNIGVEVGLSPNIADVGADIHPVFTTSKSRAWRKDNELLSRTPQDAISLDRPLYEPVFFKNSGEMTRSDAGFYTDLGESLPARAELFGSGLKTGTKPAVRVFSNQMEKYTKSYSSGVALRRLNREKRNEVFSFLPYNEARSFGLNKKIVSYNNKRNRFLSGECEGTEIIHPLNGSRRRHHISEVTVTRPDGSRYVYGIPAYNEYQSEVTFSVDPGQNQLSNTGGLITYTTQDDSPGNQKGRENFFDRTELPPYAYAHLLTGVLSPDYIDRTGDGVSEDDDGSAIRFNYHRRTGQFKWRTPMAPPPGTNGVARHQRGFLSQNNDDKASYLYGEKEVWYVHSIESNTMLAQFFFSPREDAQGVSSTVGQLDPDINNRLCKLDSIALYSKKDLQKGNGVPSDPIKVVHFTYDYLLCPGTPNSTAPGGKKLTLTHVYFTYGKGGKGRLNAYKFHYYNGPVAHPFSYNINNVDRWGTYKIKTPGYPDNQDFPYTVQNDKIAAADSLTIHEFSKAWNLTRIELPSGGSIEVDYEPDDYAYVQNKRAGQMMLIEGFGRGANAVPTEKLYDVLGSFEENNDYVFVNLDKLGLPNNTVPNGSHFLARFMEGIEKIYFKCLVDLDNKDHWEYVNGYFEWDKGRDLICPAPNSSGNMPRVGIPIKLVNREGGGQMNPVTGAAFQLMRRHLPGLAYPGSEPGTNFGKALLQSMIGKATEIATLFEGFEPNRMGQSFASRIEADSQSYIRLYNPVFKKYGGGCRVKQIRVRDNWNQMTGQNEASYGQTYSYTVADSIRVGNAYIPVTMSSGVASYEPILGGEENMMRQPLSYTIRQLLAPDNSYWTEKPFGESLFPAPVVGYSQVTVKSLNQDAGMQTGWTNYQFYTAREFPTITDYTTPDKKEPYLRKLLNYFKIRVNHTLTMSQGFMVEVNDMHGKMKKEAVYSENGSLVSSTEYHYKVKDENAKEKRLDNLVRGITRTGVIEGTPHQLGVDVDIWQDARQEETETLAPGATFNTEGFVTGIWPWIIPFVIGLLQKEETHFQSHTITKFVKRYGILDKVTHIRDGSRLTTENLYYDNETGAVLMTKTQNEFADPVYNFTYPAHWAYKGMGQAYQNIGTYFNNIRVVNGQPQLLNGSELPGYEFMFAEGDELAYRPQVLFFNLPWQSQKLHVYRVNTLAGGHLLIYDERGKLFTSPGTVDIKIIRSGRRNMASVSVGSFMAKNEPAAGASIQDFTALGGPAQIVDATANTFHNLWQMDCICDFANNNGNPGDTINPYRWGILGNWRPRETYVNYRQRADFPTASTAQTNIRIDGLNDQFQRFWSLNLTDTTWRPNIQPGWTMKSQATRYDTRNHQLEERDALNIFSGAQIGYAQSLTTAVAHNSKQTQMYFDGFEDWAFAPNVPCVRGCPINRPVYFAFTGEGFNDSKLVDTVAHTGKHAYLVDGEVASNSLTIPIGEQDVSVIKTTPTRDHYTQGPAACLSSLAPTPGDYLASVWVKVDANCQRFSPPELAVAVNGVEIGSFSVDFGDTPIDGWRRIFGKFTISSSLPLGSTFRIYLRSNNPGIHVFFDDLRIHPWLGNMQAFVYNIINLRLMATLDENNYATFYEYDPEGKLIRTKRETERGIMTLQENRASLRPNN